MSLAIGALVETTVKDLEIKVCQISDSQIVRNTKQVSYPVHSTTNETIVLNTNLDWIVGVNVNCVKSHTRIIFCLKCTFVLIIIVLLI